MVRKLALWILIVIVSSLLVAFPALAGGWAVITLDELPGEIAPGQPFTIGFTIRQHGNHLMEGLEPVITLSNASTRERLNITAEPGDQPGHYRSTLELPTEGEWTWSIQAFTMNQEMPPLVVSPASNMSLEPRGIFLQLPIVAGSLGIAVTLAALGILFRKRARWAIPLLLAGFLVSIFGFISAAAGSSQAASPAVQAGSLEETGQRLFLAKGCTTCHNHEEIRRDRDTIYVDIGPDLSNFTADPDYLRSWLQDPASIKPETYMPDLDLSEGEIEALIAFLNEG